MNIRQLNPFNKIANIKVIFNLTASFLTEEEQRDLGTTSHLCRLQWEQIYYDFSRESTHDRNLNYVILAKNNLQKYREKKLEQIQNMVGFRINYPDEEREPITCVMGYGFFSQALLGAALSLLCAGGIVSLSAGCCTAACTATWCTPVAAGTSSATGCCCTASALSKPYYQAVTKIKKIDARLDRFESLISTHSRLFTVRRLPPSLDDELKEHSQTVSKNEF